jgi:hypothetical protein
MDAIRWGSLIFKSRIFQDPWGLFSSRVSFLLGGRMPLRFWRDGVELAVQTTEPRMTKDIRPGPIRHETLPADLLEKIGIVHQQIGRYLGETLEQFEVGFMRDIHPEREVALWCRITLAWNAYHVRHLGGKLHADKDEKKILGALLAISTGVDDAGKLGVPTEIGQRLLDYYLHPTDD